MDPQQITSHLNHILPTVRVPGRYTGGELNEVVKDWGQTKVHTALFFPELYDLGMSNLGIMILYDLINQRPAYAAERVYLPWTDMEEAMRNQGVPLYSLETKHALADFDLVAVSLPYESLYTNLLNGLDLAGLPLRSRDRHTQHPLIIAGGHGVFNPEPIAPFLDAVVIGEGEEVILEILDLLDAHPPRQTPRSTLLQKLSQLQGIYVPAFYRPIYHSNGLLKDFIPLHDQSPRRIQKRILPQLPPSPTRLIVPYIDIVHNRAPIEIMRGCTRGCRFCHAGMINRPIRERSVEEIITTMEALIPATGFSEFGLLSLSSSDYTNIVELVEAINERFPSRGISISLPSLRIESVSVELMEALSGQRRGGFTLAPEAATERMRKVINKPIPNRQLLDTAREIYQRGWHTIKLYFMIGLPGEQPEDVHGITTLSKAVLNIGKQVLGHRAKVHVSVSTFIPKPFTPFQWAEAATLTQIDQALNLLKQELRGKNLKLSWNDPESSIFEAWLARGDRRLAAVIEQAWRLGGKFDAWKEHFDFQRWTRAFRAAGLNPDFYAHRQRSQDELLPWGHIHSGVNQSYLWRDYQLSLVGKTRIDCREECQSCGILAAYSDLRPEKPGPLWLCPDGSC